MVETAPAPADVPVVWTLTCGQLGKGMHVWHDPRGRCDCGEREYPEAVDA